jgi:acetyl esterase/lipase
MLSLMAAVCLSAQAEWKPLWPADAPAAPRPAAGTEKSGDGLRLTDIEQPQYFLYPAPEANRNGKAVVVLPGGGYTMLASGHEGHEYCRWLNERGITAMLVKYRVSGNDALQYSHPVPHIDARRALRTLRSMAGEYGIKQVGIMGSSAGGHLAATCATRFRDRYEQETQDAIDQLECRPDFAILIYPVISMTEISHGGSKRRLLGPSPTAEMIEALSTEKQVSKDTPPCFLLSTADDMVDCRNSLRFADACKTHGVPVTLHLFEKGGHGYGLHGKGGVSAWPTLLDEWLKAR